MLAGRKFETWAVAFVTLLLLLLAGLNAFTPPGSALHVSNFTINLYGKYLCYAILAISVDLLWGYMGLLSLGQALFFSIGGYMMGMYLMRMIGDLGQYHKPIPDFLIFLGWSTLPAFWRPFASLPFAMLMAMLLPESLRSRLDTWPFARGSGEFIFSILTQAFTYGACLLFFRNSLLMGGNNGFTDFKFVLGYDLRSPSTQRVLYIITIFAVLFIYAGCRWLNSTKFGLIQRAIRDSENRVLFSGYAAGSYKLFAFVFAALIAAIGGVLYVPQVGIINPSEMAPDKSLEAVVWVAVGGRGTLLGPVLGAFTVNAMKSWATRAYPDMWLLFLGALFVLVTLFMPKGLVGLPEQLRTWRTRLSKRHKEPVAKPADPAPPLTMQRNLVSSK